MPRSAPAQPEAPRAKPAEPLAKPEEPARPIIPPPPPPPPAAEKMVVHPVKGEAFTRSLIKIMDDQVNKTIFGWRPNSILFGKMGLTDNVNNLQLGVLEVARRTVVVLNENMSRFALTEAQNPYLNNAMNFFMVSPEKYWFPSASGKYKEAMANLEQYIDDLKHNRSHFYTRVDNLIALMNHFRDVLGSAFHNLIKDHEPDGSPVSIFVCDDYFYFAQGVAMSMAEILEGVKEDFADQLARKNSTKLVDDAIHALHTGSQLSPWFITNAAKDGILANHRANMATYIGEAEHIIFTLDECAGHELAETAIFRNIANLQVPCAANGNGYFSQYRRQSAGFPCAANELFASAETFDFLDLAKNISFPGRKGLFLAISAQQVALTWQKYLVSWAETCLVRNNVSDVEPQEDIRHYRFPKSSGRGRRPRPGFFFTRPTGIF